MHPDLLTLDFSAAEVGSGVKRVEAILDGTAVTNGQVIDLNTLSLGDHTLTMKAVDNLGNESNKSVTFSVMAIIQSIIAGVNRFYNEGKIDDQGIANSLTQKLENFQKDLDKGNTKTVINKLQDLINEVQAQSGKHIITEAANLLIADAQWVIDHLK